VSIPSPGARSRVPLVVKLVYTAFCLVLVPFYWVTYGPTNFLYFCDMALLFTLAAVWTESPLLASMPAVGILVPQLLWVVDLVGVIFGWPVTGMTSYMFKESIPLFARLLSSFHGWLPFLLVYLVYRLGYDRRALVAWTLLAWALMLVCFLFLPPPPAPADKPNLPVNVNYVYGPSDAAPQAWMAPGQWLAVMMVGLPLLFFLPADLMLRWLPKWQPPAAPPPDTAVPVGKSGSLQTLAEGVE
jgi:hypothetical protein